MQSFRWAMSLRASLSESLSFRARFAHHASCADSFLTEPLRRGALPPDARRAGVGAF